jgi:hypothetical protein
MALAADDAPTGFERRRGDFPTYDTLRIPSHSLHPFRSNPYTDSNVFVHL